MAKDSYWFRHDSNAGRGLRLRKIQHIYGHWGKGVYWDVIEILREQDKYRYECDELGLQMLCDLIGCKDNNRFISWFNDCIKYELFEKRDNYFYSEVLLENMEIWETKKFNGSKGGRPSKNRNETETISETKANRNIIEYNRIEYNKDNKIIDKENIFKTEVLKHTQYSDEMLKDFISYWTEKSKSGKLRFEGEKYFDVGRRLATWKTNEQKFNKDGKRTFTDEAKEFIKNFTGRDGELADQD